MEVGFAKGLLSVTAKDADVRALIDAIAKKSGVEIVLDKMITGKVTVEFKNLKFEEGLKKALNEILGGGFVGEYVRKPGAKEGFALERVVIARQAPLPNWSSVSKGVEEKDILRINEMYVGEAKGEEVLFVPWGDGEGQIPRTTWAFDEKVYRVGVSRLRIGADGGFYLDGPGNAVRIYSRDGRFKKALDTSGTLKHAMDVDDEGRIYLTGNAKRRDDKLQQEVFVYDDKYNLVARTWTPHSNCNAVRNGVLRDWCDSVDMLADFRYLSKNPGKTSGVVRWFQTPTTILDTDPLRPRPDVATLVVQRSHRELGLPQDTITAPYPQEWKAMGYGRAGDSTIAFVGGKLFVIIGVATEKWPHDDFGFAVLDLNRKAARYYRIPENDTFVSETGETPDIAHHYFDVDDAGNVYFLFTSKEGVHVCRYPTEGTP